MPDAAPPDPAGRVPDGPVLFYDGGCGLCHRSVRWFVRLDRRERLTFAPLFGELFSELVPPADRAGLPDSLVLRTADARLHVRSNAVLRALVEIGGVWRPIARILRWIPRALRDRLYDAIARARQRWFAKPEGACPLLPPELRARFRA